MRLLRRSLPLFCALILALILSLSLAACGERSKARPSSGTPETSSLPIQPPAEPAPPGGDCGLNPATRPDGGGCWEVVKAGTFQLRIAQERPPKPPLCPHNQT